MLDHVEMTAAHTHSGTFFRVDSRSVSKNCFVLLPSMLSSYTIFCYFGKLPTLRISSATEQRLFCGLACSIYRGWKEVSALRLLLCLSESIVLNLTFKRGIGDLVTSLFVRACPCAIHAPINRWLYSVCRLLKEAGGWGWGRLQVHVCVLVCVFARMCALIRKWTAGPEGAVCLSLRRARKWLVTKEPQHTHTHKPSVPPLLTIHLSSTPFTFICVLVYCIYQHLIFYHPCHCACVSLCLSFTQYQFRTDSHSVEASTHLFYDFIASLQPLEALRFVLLSICVSEKAASVYQPPGCWTGI